jgi:hypothetical protein
MMMPALGARWRNLEFHSMLPCAGAAEKFERLLLVIAHQTPSSPL